MKTWWATLRALPNPALNSPEPDGGPRPRPGPSEPHSIRAGRANQAARPEPAAPLAGRTSQANRKVEADGARGHPPPKKRWNSGALEAALLDIDPCPSRSHRGAPRSPTSKGNVYFNVSQYARD
jgi:hypothetical protein